MSGSAPEARRIGIVVSRYNSLITDRLLEGALDTLEQAGGDRAATSIIRVPGSFEIPLAARRLARDGRVDAVVCLGCLIQGETDHYHYLAAEVSRGVGAVALECDLPVTFGVITARTTEQAFARSGGEAGNKGAEAMEAAVDMVDALAGRES